MSSLAAGASAPRVGAVAVPRVDLPGLLLGLALAAGLAGTAFAGAGGIRLEDSVPVELAVTAVGTGLAAGAVYTGRGPVRMFGLVTLGLLAALTGWTAISILWSVAPSDSWIEANRTLSYLAAFAGGLSLVRLLPQRWSAFAGGVLGACMAVCVYAMLTKVFPHSLDAEAVISRLRAPFDYWNAIGLMAALAAPLCLWLGVRRTGHALISALAYPALSLALVTMVLAYSRGALLAAIVGGILWFVIVPLRLRGVVMLVVSTIGAAIVLLWALNQDGLAADHIPLIVRDETGSEFGVLLVLMGVAIYLAGLGANFFVARHPLAGAARRTVGTIVLIGVAMIPVLGLGAVALSSNGLGGTLDSLTNPDAKVPSNGPDRLTATGSVRARYWRDALRIWTANPFLGAGAGAYPTIRARYRKDDIQVRHAHGYVVQTLSDLGAMGLVLSLATLVAWLIAAGRPAGITARAPWNRRAPPGPAVTAPPGPAVAASTGHPPSPSTVTSTERAAVVAIAAVVVTFGVHSLVDWTWFVPGPAVTGLVCAGWVAGRGPLDGPLRERSSAPLWLRALGAGGIALVGLALLWAIWQPLRSVQADDDAVARLAKGDVPGAIAATKTAESRNPLSSDPLFERATILESHGQTAAARATLEQAVRLQPSNPATWQRLAIHFFAVEHQPTKALQFARAAVFLDPHSVEARGILLAILRAAKNVTPPAAAKPKPLTTPGN